MAAEERDYLFRDTIEEIDPCVAELIERETERQKQAAVDLEGRQVESAAVRTAISHCNTALFVV